MEPRWHESVLGALSDLGDRAAAVVPNLVVALVLVLLGFVVGWLASVIVTRVARIVALDRHMERWGVAGWLRRSGIFRTPAEILGTIVFWGVFVILASVAIDSLGLPGATGATAFLIAFLPPLFASVLIVVVGLLVANFVSQGILIAAVNAGVPEARFLARAVQYGVVLFAVATALTHMGIGREMVLVAFAISFGGLVLALAIAFGLGGRHIARDILARRLRRESPPREEHFTQL